MWYLCLSSPESQGSQSCRSYISLNFMSHNSLSKLLYPVLIHIRVTSSKIYSAICIWIKWEWYHIISSMLSLPCKNFQCTIHWGLSLLLIKERNWVSIKQKWETKSQTQIADLGFIILFYFYFGVRILLQRGYKIENFYTKIQISGSSFKRLKAGVTQGWLSLHGMCAAVDSQLSRWEGMYTPVCHHCLSSS